MAILSRERSPLAPRRFARLYVPRATLCTAWEFLARAGARAREQLCFLAGRIVADADGPAGQVTCCVLPHTLADAGYVTLASHAQSALILDTLERRRETPLMTLHTHGDGGWHGGGCEHSAIDDAGVGLTPEDGLFSGIVPWYARGSPASFVAQASFYERSDGKWLRIPEAEKERRVLVHDDAVRIVPGRPERRT
jgi:hypothetical protein